MLLMLNRRSLAARILGTGALTWNCITDDFNVSLPVRSIVGVDAESAQRFKGKNSSFQSILVEVLLIVDAWCHKNRTMDVSTKLFLIVR